MNLGIEALVRKLEAAAALHFEGARVATKVNHHGEVVVAVILPRRYTPEGFAERPPRKASGPR